MRRRPPSAVARAAGPDGRRLDRGFFARDSLAVARSLLGATLVHGDASGVIVEVEAYKDDLASHYVTRRPSAGPLMGGTFGHIYIYRIYGLHRCLNFTADARGPGAVLLRALEPRNGIEAMRRRRAVDKVEDLCRGPANLVEALGVDPGWNGKPIEEAFTLLAPEGRVAIEASPRVGIRAAADLPWRFSVRGSRFVSRPPRVGGASSLR